MMVAYIHIRDAQLDMVEGVAVTAIWTQLAGTASALSETAVTNEQGIAIFETFSGAGDYEICVDNIVDVDADDEFNWVYDPDRNRATCATYWLPPYPYPYPFQSKP
jgi:hypothetical protein